MSGKGIVLGVLVLAVGLLGSGCWCPSLQGSGVLASEKRPLSAPVRALELRNHARVTVQEGAEPGLEVTGDDNLVPYIRTRVEGETLVVENAPELQGGYRSRKGIQVLLTLPGATLREAFLSSHGSLKVPRMAGEKVVVRLSSHGDLDVDRVEADRVGLQLSSHGTVRVGVLEGKTLGLEMSSHGDVLIGDGRVETQRVTLSSHGRYRADKLVCEEAEVDLSSHGVATLHVTRRLSATVTSHGSIRYRGQPQVDVPEKQRKKVRPF